MAISVDSVATTEAVGGSSISVSLTPAGSDRIILSGFHVYEGASTYQPTSWDFNTSETITEIHDQYDSPGDAGMTLGRLTAPTATTANVVAAYGSLYACKLSALAISGVDQTTPIDNLTKNVNALSITVTSETDDLAMAFITNIDTSISPDDTEHYNENSNFHTGACESDDGAASVVLSWTDGSTGASSMIGCNINEAAGGGGGGRIMSSLAKGGGLSGFGGIAGQHGGLAA